VGWGNRVTGLELDSLFVSFGATATLINLNPSSPYPIKLVQDPIKLLFLLAKSFQLPMNIIKAWLSLAG